MLEAVIAPVMRTTTYWSLGGGKCDVSAGIGTVFESPWDLNMFLWR